MSILNDKQSFCTVYGFSHSKEIRVNYSIWVVIKLCYSQDKKHFTLNKSRYREYVKSYFTLAKVFFSSYNKRGKKETWLPMRNRSSGLWIPRSEAVLFHWVTETLYGWVRPILRTYITRILTSKASKSFLCLTRARRRKESFSISLPSSTS